MRVQGNVYPESITVETYLPIPGMVEIRLRENVKHMAETQYEYDEYTKIMPDLPGLKQAIIDNLSDWLTTLRTLEVNENASILRDLSDENDSLMADIAQIVDDVYQSDMEIMGL